MAIMEQPVKAVTIVERLKQSLFGPSCSHYQLKDEYDHLLTRQLRLTKSVQSVMPDWSGPPQFTSSEVRAAAKYMHEVSKDSTQRTLIRQEDAVIYIAFKFWIMKGAKDRDLLLSSRLSVYDQGKAQWAMMKKAIETKCSGRDVILTGYGLGGALSVLMGLKLYSVKSVRSVRILTFDDPPLFLKDPDTNHLLSKLAHLKMLSLDQPSDDGCAKVLFLHDHVDKVMLPYDRFMDIVDEAPIPQDIDYALYFDHSMPASIGTQENVYIEGSLKRIAAHATMATPIYAANRRLIDKKRAKETACKLSAMLSQKFATMIVCKPTLFRSIDYSFHVHCELVADERSKSLLLDFKAQLQHTKADKRKACQKMLATQTHCPKTQSERCVKSLRRKSDEVAGLFFSCTHIDVDKGRLGAVLVPQKPLQDGVRLLEKHLITSLINPSDPFPLQCEGLIQGSRCSTPHPKLWELSRLFFTTLTRSQGKFPVCRMASKRDSVHFEVKRIIFSLHSMTDCSLSVKEIKACLVEKHPVDCTDPVNHWIRPRVCPRRCKGLGKELCKEVRACRGGVFVSVQQAPLFMGGLEEQVGPNKKDAYVAYHLRSREASFGFLGLRSQFHLLFTFD